MRRRTFLTITAGTFVGAMTSRAAETARTRPNILFAIADDQSWPHTSIGGDPVVKTPTFDRLAREGVLFSNAFCSAPSCTASRGAVLTGRDFWQLGSGGNLWSALPASLAVYPDILEEAGYHVGATRKGWGPGNLEASGRKRNPAGPHYRNFTEFLDTAPDDKPFCFWFGSQDPHRPYKRGSGAASGMDPDKVVVPGFLPDSPEVRGDILDYFFEIERFDREAGELVAELEERGQLDNTIVVMTSDNGMPFPRAKANIYDHGVHMPLAVRWGAAVPGGRTVDDFIGFTDFAPTFLEAAGIKPPAEMTGRSFLNVLTSDKFGVVDATRSAAFFGRERHTDRRGDALSYPSRGIRTREYLYIRNFKPDRWPACDPPVFGDIDGQSPTKSYLLAHRDEPGVRELFDLATGKRPAEELYRVTGDPYQLQNLADEEAHADTREKLAAALEEHLRRTNDPRITGNGDVFDTCEYFGGRPRSPGEKRGK